MITPKDNLDVRYLTVRSQKGAKIQSAVDMCNWCSKAILEGISKLSENAENRKVTI